MADALDELSDLSEFLQRKKITMPQADKAIRTAIRVFESMDTNPGPKLSEAYAAIGTGMFTGVTIKQMGKVQPINCGQFFRSPANNLQSRLITTTSAHTSSMTGENTQYNAYIELLNNINILRFENWPEVVDI
jgi:hypothetical protein